jgi:TRAP-type C4-dicarboxylate transport system permease small subunit
MTLNNPETRRALRAVVQAVILLAFVWFVYLMIDRADPRWLIGVIAIAVIGNQLENGVRAFKVSAGKDGLTVEADGDQ